MAHISSETKQQHEGNRDKSFDDLLSLEDRKYLLKHGKMHEADAGTILSLIKELADYEHLSHEVVATEDDIRRSLFGPHPFAEALIGEYEGTAISFALFFYNFSTFIGKPGIYLEDLYIKPEYRRLGFGRKMLVHIARLAKDRNCGRFE